MKTYYITYESQGNTELVVKVDAESEKEAIIKANEAFISGHIDVSVDTEAPEYDCMIVNENGEEC